MMGAMTALEPQPSAVVIGAVISAALATLVLTIWAWWPKLRTAFWRRKMAPHLWRNRRRALRAGASPTSAGWIDDRKVTTLWSVLWLRKREEPRKPFRVSVDSADITDSVRSVQLVRALGDKGCGETYCPGPTSPLCACASRRLCEP